jgi:hypothetical protein
MSQDIAHLRSAPGHSLIKKVYLIDLLSGSGEHRIQSEILQQSGSLIIARKPVQKSYCPLLATSQIVRKLI